MKKNIPLHFCDKRFSFPHIHHGFTTRYSGYSKGDFSSLDLGRRFLDPKDDFVVQNRTCLANSLKIPPQDLVFLNQEHGTTIHIFENKKQAISSLVGDGVISFVPDLFVAILSADCVPVLITHQHKKIVAAIHAGWRGSAAGIIAKAANTFIALGQKLIDFSCVIGPCIHFPYEVGQDVYEAFCGLDKQFQSFFCPLPNEQSHHHTYWMNLAGIVAYQLRLSGFGQVFESRWNTYIHENLFFSCRRSFHQGKNFGLLGSFIAPVST